VSGERSVARDVVDVGMLAPCSEGDVHECWEGSCTRARKTDSSLREGSVHQKIHGGWSLVARHEPLAEVAREIVVCGLRPGLEDSADRIREAPLHSESRKRIEDAFHLGRRNQLELWAAEIEDDPAVQSATSASV